MIRAIYRYRASTIRTEAVYMYAKGMKLEIVNAPPESYRIELADGKQLTVDSNIVRIPDEQFTKNRDIEMYMVIESGEAVNTVCKIIVPLIWRPQRNSP